ncbi:SPOR domain-containing protein [Pseudoruegeria sp. HB172150]|uniref:SPOR domain-containing protein n=1 Tax=Pseudoruegeria sp. HB172150 TaxID=2721164 RepID=UPI0020A693CE|nr:SPOR domain-containing protein [Pseudoruegeria sp. HB172150]
MADMYLGGRAEPDGVAGQSVFGFIFNWVGAISSVALIAGLGLWGYQLLMRDVSGVPVVRALEGPMRVTPEEPGGEQAEHQGLAVNNVAAEGVAEGPADRLVLAPPPLDLTEEDQPTPTLSASEATETTEVIASPEERASADDVMALADELTSGVTPLSAIIEEKDMAAEIIPASIPGVSASPVPRVRPAGFGGGTDATAEAVAASVARAVAAPAVEVDPETIAEGTRLVQFGAFASPDEARQEWARLDARFTDFLTDKSRVIEKAVSGGKTFYRLRAEGFEDIADARRFCSAFVAEKQACIPVVAR